MAVIIPGDWRASEVLGGNARVIETLALFARGLPASLTVFHGVHWTRVERGLASIGEIDFVVLAPSGHLLLIEQKTGFLEESPDGLLMRHAGRKKLVRVEVDRTVDALRRRLGPALQGAAVPEIGYLLHCPDYHVREPGSAGMDPARIVDASAPDTLCQRVITALGADAGSNGPADDPLIANRLHRFFANELELVPDASAMVGRAEAIVTRLSGGLATWARRLDADPFRLRVLGTAGSGKTQLALALLQDAARDGREARYICFNRPLADHLARVAPAGTSVQTYHQWCEQRLRAAGATIDFRSAGAFADLVSRAQALAATESDRVDLLVVDEGQDIEPGWREDMFDKVGRAGARGRIVWLEDPMQNLYDREPFEPDGWITLSTPSNYRSPRRLARFLTRLHDMAHAGRESVIAESPFVGERIELFGYADTEGLADASKRAITAALRAGFRRQDIALLSFAGRERSRLLSLDTLGPHALRRFTGQYDLFGSPRYSDGDLVLETVYRFKGQSAPCVIFTEVEFETLDARARRKLFVGASRASMRLFVVASQACVPALESLLDDD